MREGLIRKGGGETYPIIENKKNIHITESDIKKEEGEMTKRQHKRALAIIKKLMDKDPNKRTLEGRALNLLAEFVQEYEKEMWPLTPYKKKEGK